LEPLQKAREFGAILFGATLFFGKDDFTADGPQLLDLRFKGLAIGADAGVAIHGHLENSSARPNQAWPAGAKVISFATPVLAHCFAQFFAGFTAEIAAIGATMVI
jgi:hypothetical protein